MIRVEQPQHIEQIIRTEIDRRRGQHQLVRADIPEQAARPPGTRFFVAHVVRFIEDHQVQQRLLIGMLVEQVGEPGANRALGLVAVGGIPITRNADALVADDPCTFPVLGRIQLLPQRIRIDDTRIQPEARRKLEPPLLPQHGWAHHQQATHVVAGAQLRPDQSCLDRLAQTHFVRDQQTVDGGVQQGQQGLVLMRVKVGLGQAHGIDDVRQTPGQMDVRQQLAQVVHASVTSFADQLQRIVTTRISGDQLLLVVPIQTPIPVHAALRAGRTRTRLIGHRADLGRIIDMADELSWTPRHVLPLQILSTIFSSLSSALV